MADKRISQLTDRGTVANNDVVPIVVSGAVTTNKATISSIQTFMQGNLDLGVTSVGFTLTQTDGQQISVTGSPITTSGNITLNLPRATNSIRGLLDSEDFINFSNKQSTITLTTTGTSGAATLLSNTLNIPNYAQDLSGFVTLGTAQTITAQKTITSNGGSDTFIVNHTSGSGIGVNITKGGNGEGLIVNKTSGSGNAATITGTLQATTIVRTGGTSVQYLMADGSVSTLTNPITGTLATGQVAFGTAANTVGGSNNLFFDNANGRLGVRTNAPAVPLHVIAASPTGTGFRVDSSVASTGITLATNFDETGRVITFRAGFSDGVAPSLAFNTGSPATERWRITQTGILQSNGAQTIRTSTGALTLQPSNNVLIGTTTDAGFRLDVNGTARVQGVLTTTADAVVNGVNIGLGGGAISTNTRVGNLALNINTTGGLNTAIGVQALLFNTTGGNNTASGVNALRNNATGSANTANGVGALQHNTTGINNTASGFEAGRRIAAGTNLTIANNSVFLGFDTRAAADNQTNQIVIGHTAIGLGSNTTVLGNSSTTFGRWFGNLLIGSSTNTGQQLQVTGTSFFTGAVTLTGELNGTTAQFNGRISSTLGANDINLTANVGGQSNRLETTGALPLALVSSQAISLAAGGVTPQITLSTAGAVTLTGALNGTSAVFSGDVTTTNAARPYFISKTTSVGEEAGIKIQQGSVSNWIIGTAQGSPSAQDLAIRDAQNGRIPLFFAASTGAATFSSSVTAKGSINGFQGSTHNLLIDFSSSSQVTTLTNTELFFGTNAQRRMTITAGGNVGIGTATPNAPLHVVKDLGTSVDAVLRLRGSNSTARTTRLQFEDYNGTIADGVIDFVIPTAGISTGARLDIGVNGINMSLIEGGNVGIGTASPGHKLDVDGAIRTGSPTGSSAQPFKVGSVTTTTDSFFGTILKMEINGVVHNIMIAEPPL